MIFFVAGFILLFNRKFSVKIRFVQMFFDTALTIVGVLLLVGALSCKISSRFNLPTLLLFLAAGAVAEYFIPVEGSGFVEQINHFGIISMAYIL